MNVQKIYDKYKIMPQLQLHQLRVAGVASLIVDNFEENLDKESIISACLLHDMGNIIKFNLALFPEFLKPHGLKYWKGIKQGFIDEYGNDEHIATYKIAKDVGVSENVKRLINSFGLSKALENSKHNNFSKKICAYSDHRVSPKGVMLLKQKLLKGKRRFSSNKQMDKKEKIRYEVRFKTYFNHMLILEDQIFEKCSIDPEDVTDKEVKPLIDSLRNFEIETRKQ